ncbi:dihydroxyacetone kinase [Thozetella sp. PMI_491]|nr:dihydroxyacetone kinase [Thozetella sp. PMI_491]
MASPSRSFLSSGPEALDTALRGFVASHPGLKLHKRQRIVYRSTPDSSPQQRISLLSGGGSGHEPAHIGYVGSAMLDAAVCGSVFASPNALQIEAGLDLVQSPKGILVIVKNYTGDKLNFTLAAQRFRFRTGIPVRLVVVTDDVSIGRAKSARVGRRGLAGTVLIHKIAGAAAATGLSLDEVAEIAEFANRNMGTIGAALDGCDIPGQKSMPRLECGQIELGIGIHNEPGSRRITSQPTLDLLVAEMLSNILSTEDQERGFIASLSPGGPGDIVLLINNLGGLSPFEIAAVAGEVLSQLSLKYQAKPVRVYVGTFLSALNGPGFSITILNLPRDEKTSGKVLEFLDTPTDASGWVVGSVSGSDADLPECEEDSAAPEYRKAYDVPNIPCDPASFSRVINAIYAALVADEPEITRLDCVMGDGDCGTTLLAGAAGVVAALESKAVNASSLSEGTMAVAEVISQCMGGTSGALYAVFFTALASSISGVFQERGIMDFPAFASALQAALSSLEQVTAAREGDRTMMDALIPFIRTLAANTDVGYERALHLAVEAARAGCEATRIAESKFGRSTYVSAGEDVDRTKGMPDPGACGVVAIVKGLLNAL